MTPTLSPPPTGFAAIDALLLPLNRSNAPGLVVGIAREGRTIYRRGVGLASVEQGVAMAPATRVRIASTSKQFTCLGVLLLAEQGRLDIDDPVYRHLPELPVLHPAGPTLRQLMQHTGGWRTDLLTVAQGLAPQPLADWTQPIRESNRALNFEPGTRMIYSNTGYQLLARVIERLSGQTFEDFLRERIFTPLQMYDTESVTSDLDIRPGMAMQYLPAAGGGLRRGIYPSELRGSGSLVSTVDDMLRWLAHLRAATKVVGSAASWAQMIEPARLSTGMELPYTLGLMRHDYRGVEVIHHAGAVLGATAQMITVPSHALDIMIMVNGAPVSPVALGWQIIDALLGEQLGAPAELVASAGRSQLFGRHYRAPESGAVFGFEDIGGKLALNWLGGRAIPLRRQTSKEGTDLGLLPCEETALNPLGLTLEQIAGDSAPATLILDEGGHLQHCELLPAQKPSSTSLAAALVGRYRVPDLQLGADIVLMDEGDEAQLIVKLQGPHGSSAYRLLPLSAEVLLAMPTDALFAGVGGAGVVSIERDGARVTGLRLDAARLRRLQFIREETAA